MSGMRERRSLRTWLLAAVPVAGLMLAVTLVRSPDRPVESPDPPGGCKSIGGLDESWCTQFDSRGAVACDFPDITGTDLREAYGVVTRARYFNDNDLFETSYVASREPEGHILASFNECSGPAFVLVSDGGPVARVDSVPIEFRRLLGESVADDAPVRVIDTAEGLAWKTDDVLVGSCVVTELIDRSSSDGRYDERCPGGG